MQLSIFAICSFLDLSGKDRPSPAARVRRNGVWVSQAQVWLCGVGYVEDVMDVLLVIIARRPLGAWSPFSASGLSDEQVR
jgi:hypothetical protein